MGKMVVLKPIVWNDRGYMSPAGLGLSSGYAQEHGYGNEEWNARPDRVWNGWKVFHTQGKGKMFEYAERGDLGIIMTTMREGKFYAVGVACNVYMNSEEDCQKIADALNLFADGDALWRDLKAVRARKKNRADFNRHWKQAYRWVQWRCPPSHFHWFDRPVPISPNDLIPSEPPRQAIVMMHSAYQAIRPDQAISIIEQHIPGDHLISGWLQAEDFDERILSKAVRKAPAPKGLGRRYPAPPSDPYRRYIAENELVIPPRHNDLQKAFERFVHASGGANIMPDVDRVDLQYTDPKRGRILVEVKPTESTTVRFAIRAAIGQLLDYQQKYRSACKLLVVIDSEPTSHDDKALALGNGFGLAWRRGNAFDVLWPEEALDERRSSHAVASAAY